MAKQGPSFQFYPTDIAPDLDPLTMEERGMYMTLMRYLWTVGPMPIDEAEALIGKAWVSCGAIFRRKFTEKDSTLCLEWMEEQREKQATFRRVQAENGCKGGRPRKEKKGSLYNGKPKANPKESPRVGVGIGVCNGIGKERASELQWPKWAGPNVLKAWDEFKAYRWATHKVKYKSESTEQHAVNLLAKYYKTGEQCFDGLNLAMAKGWKFPVDPSELTAKALPPAPSPTLKPWMQ